MDGGERSSSGSRTGLSQHAAHATPENLDVDNSAPIDVDSGGAGEFWQASWIAHATAGFVALGILLRAARYLLNFPLWCDETMLGANFLDKNYSDLLFRPLVYRQIGPPLFLIIQLSATKVLGFSELSLRFFPALCGIASVPLFRHVAGRLLRGVPLLMAVAVFAVSGWPLRYVAEVKPYASDLFVALGLLALAVEWRRAPERVGWLWALVVAGPIAVALSLPAVFTVGGIGLALAWPVWKTRSVESRTALGLFGAVSALTFLGLLRFYKTAPQDHDYFHNAWSDAFPPLTNPLRLLIWLLDVHTGYMFAYPDGGAHGASAVTFLCVLAGIYVIARRRNSVLLALLLMPFALALLAAVVHRYPYGVSARTTQYAAPFVCVLMWSGMEIRRARGICSRHRGSRVDAMASSQRPCDRARAARRLHTPGVRPRPTLQDGHRRARPVVRPLVLDRAFGTFGEPARA